MNGTVFFSLQESPVGELLLVSDGEALTGLYMEGHSGRSDPAGSHRDAAPFAAAREQLAAYFAGELTEFGLPVAARGTPFQERVWAALRTIAYGETTSYAEIARRIGDPKAVRAVGAANGRNPVSILVPCHRVIGADGSLTGYGGGIERKRMLLALESGVRARGAQR